MKALTWRRVQTASASFFVLALVFVVGVLSVRSISEPDRTQAAVSAAIEKEQQRQADEQRRQAAEQQRQGAALCASFKAQAESDLLPTSTELGRSLVRTAADAYRLTRCEERSGPLGPVDPEAYQPAPTPQPTPR